MAIQLFTPYQPISTSNPFPSSSISRLSAIGVPAGVTYVVANYSQPGVSALISSGQKPQQPGNPNDVSATTIVRAG